MSTLEARFNFMNMYKTQLSFRHFFETTSLESFIFYCSYSCFSIAQIVTQTYFIKNINGLYSFCTALLYLSIALLLFRLALLKVSNSQWLVVLTICAFGFLLYELYGFQYPFWIFLFVVSGKDVDLRIVAKITLLLAGTITTLTVLACCFGILANNIMQVDGARGVRNSLGFTHPNRLAEYLSEICIAYWYLNYFNHKWRTIALCLASTVFVYAVAGARSSCIVFILIIIVTLLYPILAEMPRVAIFSCGVAALLVVILSFFFMANFNPLNGFMASLNSLLSGRLKLAHSAYSYASPSLLGNDYSGAPVVGHTLNGNIQYHFMVDNAYAHLVLLYGVIATVVFFLLVCSVYYRCFQKRIFPLALLGLTTLLIVGFSENFTLDIQYNLFLFLISGAIYQNNSDLWWGIDQKKLRVTQ